MKKRGSSSCIRVAVAAALRRVIVVESTSGGYPMDKNPFICIVDKATGRLRMTKTGIELYAESFGRLGFDIHAIRTRAALKEAVDAVVQSELSAMAFEVNDPLLDSILSELPEYLDGVKCRDASLGSKDPKG